MDVSDRKKKILSAVVDHYIDTAEPVGSKTITAGTRLGLSSATIRNEMAELESLGLLEQPHTSAGRIPTAKGYRLYVDELMRRHRLSIEETEEINRGLRAKMRQLDLLIAEVGRVAAALTDYAALSMTAAVGHKITRYDLIYIDANTFIIVALLSNNTVKNKLIKLPFSFDEGVIRKLSAVANAHFTGIAESGFTPALINAAERALCDTMGLVPIIVGFAVEILSETAIGQTRVSGTSNLLRQPEYRDLEEARKLISYLSDTDNLLGMSEPESGAVKVVIGPENAAEELRKSSVVMVKYDLSGDVYGLVGVVGPTRMDYAKVAAKLGCIADGISKIISEGEYPPDNWGKLQPVIRPPT